MALSIKQNETQVIGNRVYENDLFQSSTTYLPTQTLGKELSKMNEVIQPTKITIGKAQFLQAVIRKKIMVSNW